MKFLYDSFEIFFFLIFHVFYVLCRPTKPFGLLHMKGVVVQEFGLDQNYIVRPANGAWYPYLNNRSMCLYVCPLIKTGCFPVNKCVTI